MCKCTHACTHTHTHTFNLPLLLSLQRDSSLFSFLFSLAHFIFPSSASVFQLRIISLSVQPLLISPLLSLSIPLLILFILLTPSYFISSFFCIPPSEESISKPWFLIHSSSPVMTTSPALTFFLWGVSHDRIGNWIPPTLSAHTGGSSLCCFADAAVNNNINVQSKYTDL